jgi:hypothetical protein
MSEKTKRINMLVLGLSSRAVSGKVLQDLPQKAKLLGRFQKHSKQNLEQK